MRSPDLSFGFRALAIVAIAGTLSLGVGACGRRGRPEAPPDPSAPPAATTTSPRKTTGVKGSGGTGSGGTGSAAAATPARTTTTTADASDPNPEAPPDQRPLSLNPFDDSSTDETDQAIFGVTPTPTGSSRRRSRAYVVPKEPFILDPLL